MANRRGWTTAEDYVESAMSLAREQALSADILVARYLSSLLCMEDDSYRDI